MYLLVFHGDSVDVKAFSTTDKALAAFNAWVWNEDRWEPREGDRYIDEPTDKLGACVWFAANYSWTYDDDFYVTLVELDVDSDMWDRPIKKEN